MSGGPIRNIPRSAIWAMAATLALFLLLLAMERTAQNCGDGLCGSLLGTLAVFLLGLTALVFTFRGLARGEGPRWWFAISPAIWLFLLPKLFA